MPTYMCFVCHSTVHSYTDEVAREKYKELIGMQLCPDFHLCHICSHLLTKMWLFKSICLKRSLEYPVLFSEKVSLYLQPSCTDIHNLCPVKDCMEQHNIQTDVSKTYCITHDDSENDNYNDNYVSKDYEASTNEGIANDDFDETINEGMDVCEYFRDEFNHYNSYNAHNETETNEKANNNDQGSELNPIRNGYVHNSGTVEFDDHFEEQTNCTEHNDSNNMIEDNNIIANNELDDDSVFHSENNDIDEDKTNKITDNIQESTDVTVIGKKKKSKKGFKKMVLSVEEQKSELEARRKEKKYLESDFRCYNCALGFLFKDTYQAHMMRHEESNGCHVCNICFLRFATAGVLRAHTRLHAEWLRCRRCQEILPIRQREKHARECQSSAEANTEAPCHLCARIFKDSTRLQQHLKRFHGSVSGNRTYACSVCGNSYRSQAQVRTHMIKHINRKFPCEKCSSTFSSPYTLKQHLKKHSTPPTQYSCTTCNLHYSSRKSLLAHRRNSIMHHFTLYECGVCARPCPTQRALAAHTAEAHAATAAHACALCPARYSTRRSLLRHAALHEGKRPNRTAVCHLCGSSFSGNNKLNRHLREVCEKNKLEEQLASLYEHDHELTC